MNKCLAACLSFLFFANALAMQSLKMHSLFNFADELANRPTIAPLKNSDQVTQFNNTPMSNQILSDEKLIQMSQKILQNLTTINAFADRIRQDGPSLRNHIIRYHAILNKKTPQRGDAEYNQNKTLFISETRFGEDIIYMLRDKIDNFLTTKQIYSIAYKIQNGMLWLTIQIPVEHNSVYYFYGTGKYDCKYINVCIKKVWLGDHWSGNLGASTIYPTQTLRQTSEIVNLTSPKNNLVIEYQVLEKRDQNEVILVFDKKPTGMQAATNLDIDDASEEKLDNFIELEFADVDNNETVSADNKIAADISIKPDDKKNDLYTVTYSNGDKYTGGWKGDKQNGEGKMTYADGSTYTGRWKNDLKDGLGTAKYMHEDGSVDTYTGEFWEGKRHGQGVFQYANGDIYEGKWLRNNLKEGVVTYKNNDKYVGNFKCNEKTNLGIMSYANKDKYQGDWQDGKKHGLGKITFSNLDVYEGEFFSDEITGHGTMKYAGGNKYTGQWLNGKPCGKGELSIKNKGIVKWNDDDRKIVNFTNLAGDEYHGEWQDENPHGLGKFIVKQDKSTYESTWHCGEMQFTENTKFINKQGCIHQGQWRNGKLHGVVTLIRKNGETYERSIWDAGKIVGIEKFTDVDGNKYNGKWDAGKNGLGECIFTNQDIYTGEWKNGRPHGLGKKIIRVSGLIQEGEFANGELKEVEKKTQSSISCKKEELQVIKPECNQEEVRIAKQECNNCDKEKAQIIKPAAAKTLLPVRIYSPVMIPCSFYIKQQQNEQIIWGYDAPNNAPNDVSNLYFSQDIKLFSLPKLQQLSSIMTSGKIAILCVDSDALNCIREYNGQKIHGEENNQSIDTIVFRASGKKFAVAHGDNHINTFDIYKTKNVILQTGVCESLIKAIALANSIKNVFLMTDEISLEQLQMLESKGKKIIKLTATTKWYWLSAVVDNDDKVCIDIPEMSRDFYVLIEAIKPDVIKINGCCLSDNEYMVMAGKFQADKNLLLVGNPASMHHYLDSALSKIRSICPQALCVRNTPSQEIPHYMQKLELIQNMKLFSLPKLQVLDTIITSHKLDILCVDSDVLQRIVEWGGFKIYGEKSSYYNNTNSINTIIFRAHSKNFMTTSDVNINTFDVYKANNIVIQTDVFKSLIEAIASSNSVKNVFIMTDEISPERLRILADHGKNVIKLTAGKWYWLSVTNDKLCLDLPEMSRGFYELIEALKPDIIKIHDRRISNEEYVTIANKFQADKNLLLIGDSFSSHNGDSYVPMETRPNPVIFCNSYVAQNGGVVWTRDTILENIKDDVSNLYLGQNIKLFSMPKLQQLKVVMGDRFGVFCVDTDNFKCIREYDGQSIYGEFNNKIIETMVFRTSGKNFAVMHKANHVNNNNHINTFNVYKTKNVVLQVDVHESLIKAIVSSDFIKNVFLMTDKISPEHLKELEDSGKQIIILPSSGQQWLSVKNNRLCIDVPGISREFYKLIEAIKPEDIRVYGHYISKNEYEKSI